jgi:hypothetical protein
MTAATTSAPAVAPSPEPMMLDWLLPEFDATLVEHRVIDAGPAAVYRAIAGVDMVEIPQAYPAVRGLFAARGAAERLINALLGRPTPALEPDGPMRLADLPVHGEWVKFSDHPPWEISFGVIGRFWGGETAWETIDAADFVEFARPGFAKIACSVSLRPTGACGPSSPTRPARRRWTRTPARTSSATGASSAPGWRSSCARSCPPSRRRCADARRP